MSVSAGISEATGQTVGTVPVGSGPDAIALPATPAAGSVWVANKNDGSVTVLAPPYITTTVPPTLTARTGQQFKFQLTATGGPVPHFSAQQLPAGLTISPDGLLSGIPTPNTGGIYAAPVKATNSLGEWQTYVFLQVNQPASFPVPWFPGLAFSAGEPSAASDPSAPSFFSALREQLGLKLEAGKGPVEVLIVDHAERASEN